MTEKRRRPSCKTIAEAAGVSRMTVSMALRDHPRVAAETRRRIKEIAREQGYTPDPNLTELMRYLRKRDISKEEPVIALLNAKHHPVEEFDADALLVREGAKERAEMLGFKTEDFWLNKPGMRLERTIQILQTRGIRGVVVLPVERLDYVFSFPHEDFIGVATCSVAAQLGFNQVHPHFYQSMHIGITSLVDRGFKRIGFCIDDNDDERSNHLYQCYFNWYQERIPTENRVPPLRDHNISLKSLLRWLDEHKPDVVFSPSYEHYHWLKEAGLKIPGDVSFAALSPATEEVGEIAQVQMSYRKIGATAIDILKTKLANEPLGPTDNPAVTLIRGKWVDGTSLKGAARKRAPKPKTAVA